MPTSTGRASALQILQCHDSQVMGITLNHAGLTSRPHELRSDSYEHELLFLVHSPLHKSIPMEYLSFCVRGKLSQMGRGGLMVVKGNRETNIFPRAGSICYVPGDAARIQRHLRRNRSQLLA
ncbi:hypothetical protein TNCV_875481 [Trichonephila clavipes]|nr:hypothetical protein TNCV_875481 [Trichonephila clavipes]